MPSASGALDRPRCRWRRTPRARSPTSALGPARLPEAPGRRRPKGVVQQGRQYPGPVGPSRVTFPARSRKPNSCRLSICSRLILGWKAKSNRSSVFTAASLNKRMAVWSRRSLRSTIRALSNCLMTSAAVIAPLSAADRMPSTASSSAPGILRSASNARSVLRRLGAGGLIAVSPHGPRSGHRSTSTLIGKCRRAGSGVWRKPRRR